MVKVGTTSSEYQLRQWGNSQWDWGLFGFSKYARVPRGSERWCTYQSNL